MIELKLIIKLKSKKSENNLRKLNYNIFFTQYKLPLYYFFNIFLDYIHVHYLNNIMIYNIFTHIILCVENCLG